jgi:hypothetical protein
MDKDLKETIEDYEMLIAIPSKCEDLNIQELMLLGSVFEQCLILGIEQHPYTNDLDIEVKESIIRKTKHKLCPI